MTDAFKGYNSRFIALGEEMYINVSEKFTFVMSSEVFVFVSCAVQEEKVAVAKAKDFLESNTYSADDPYTTALSAYALALLRSPYAPLALRRLNHMAITQGTATLITLSSMMSCSLEVHLFRAWSPGKQMFYRVKSKDQMLNNNETYAP